MLDIVMMVSLVFLGGAIALVGFGALVFGFIVWAARKPEGSKTYTNWPIIRHFFVDLAIWAASLLLLSLIRYGEGRAIRNTFRQRMEETWGTSFSRSNERTKTPPKAIIRSML